MNLHATAAYMIHMLRSRSTAGHGVHSPFMFRFITEVLGGRTDREITREIESLRRDMLSDTRMIRVLDLGAGSAVMRGEERTIRKIASAAALPARDAALLARIAGSLDMIRIRERGGGMPADPRMEKGWQHPQEYGAGQRQVQKTESNQQACMEAGAGQRQRQKTGSDQQACMEAGAGQRQRQKTGSVQQPGMEEGDGQHHIQERGKGLRNGPVILELGTSLGISTLALALGAPDRKVISVEGCPELAAIASENLRNHGARNAEVICMEFSKALSHLTSLGIKVEMAFIDGNHRGPALCDYVQTIRKMGEEMIIVADDIRMNRDLISTWKKITGERNAGTGHSAGEDNSSIRNDTPHSAPGIDCTKVISPHVSGEWEDQAEYRSQFLHENTNGTPDDPGNEPVSLETFRLGMIFFLRNLTPGHYRVRC